MLSKQRKTKSLFRHLSVAFLLALGCIGCTQRPPEIYGTQDSETTDATTDRRSSHSIPPATSSSAPKLAGSSEVPLPPPSPSHPAAWDSITPIPPDPTDDVNCGAVFDGDGHELGAAISVGTPSGRPSCEETREVFSSFATSTNEPQSREVKDWACRKQASEVVLVECAKNELRIALRAP